MIGQEHDVRQVQRLTDDKASRLNVSRIEQAEFRTKRTLRGEGVQPGGDQMVPGFDISASQLTNLRGKNRQRACGEFPMCPATSLRTSLVGVTEPRTVASSLRWKRALRKAARPCLHAVFASASLLICMVPASAITQQRTAGGGIISRRSPPDAPLLHSDPQNSAQQTPPAEGSASVAGTVRDFSGGVVSGANVSLRHGDGTQLLAMMSETTGEFNFTKIPAGSYLVIVNAKGFAPFTSAEFAVGVQQA